MPHHLIFRSHDEKKGGSYRRKKRNLRGGEGEGHNRTAPQSNPGVTPLQSYPLNGSSQRDSALNNQNDMNADQQNMVNKHAGGRRRKKRTITRRNKVLRRRRKSKKLRRRSERCRRRCRTRCKRRCVRARCQNTRKSKRKGRRSRKLKRGGATANTDGPNCSVPDKPVTIVDFGGSSAGPVGATANSKGGNSTNMQAGADACNDHYATSGGRRRSRKMNGGKKETFQNWHHVFGGFGDKMTGGKSRKKHAGISRKKKAGTSKRIWKSCMSGGKVRPLSGAPVRSINTFEDTFGSSEGTWDPLYKSS